MFVTLRMFNIFSDCGCTYWDTLQNNTKVVLSKLKKLQKLYGCDILLSYRKSKDRIFT